MAGRIMECLVNPSAGPPIRHPLRLRSTPPVQEWRRLMDCVALHNGSAVRDARRGRRDGPCLGEALLGGFKALLCGHRIENTAAVADETIEG